MVHGVVYDDDLTLHQSDSPSTRRRVLPTPQFTFQPERLGRVPHAGPPTHQDLEDQCQLTLLLLPFLLTTPSLLTALTSLSLANSICPSPHLFSGTTSKNFSLIPTSSYYLPEIPITAVSEICLPNGATFSYFHPLCHGLLRVHTGLPSTLRD